MVQDWERRQTGMYIILQLFNIYAERIMRDALGDFLGGVTIGGQRITNLRYADDTTLVCNSRKELMDLLRAVKIASEERGLMLNTKKTKIMVVDGERSDANDVFSLDGDVIEEVESFEFLGSVINTGDQTKTSNGPECVIKHDKALEK